MFIERGVIKLGVEIEVAKFDDYTYQKVCVDLINADYMMKPAGLWSEWHTYHCSCTEGGCRSIRKGVLMVPPLVSCTYDGSLPTTGAEFIVSPILIADGSQGLQDLKNIWDIVTKHAVWSESGENLHGGAVSPSVHLHVSAAKVNTNEMDFHSNESIVYSQDILHALQLFSPEFFALAEISIDTDFRRGLKYRLPTRDLISEDNEGIHHGFIHVRRALFNVETYIEWRLFEATYDNWDYVERCIYLSSVVTRAFLNRDIVGKMLSIGYTYEYDQAEARHAVLTDNLGMLLELVDTSRLDFLRQVCLEQIDDDAHAFNLIDDMFAKVTDLL